MPSLHTEIGIMVAILVGAWASKVVAVALYMYCHRRRLERLGAQSGDTLPRLCTCHRRTPAQVIKDLPVMPYVKAMEQLHGMHSSHTVKPAAAGQVVVQQQQQQQPQQRQQGGEDADTVAVADQTLQLQQPQQQQAQQQLADQGAADLCRSSASSMQGAAACSNSAQWLQASAAGTDADCCPVCFTEYEATTEVRQLPCKHFYHTECIDAWLSRDNTCPLCKSIVWMPAEAADDNSSSSATSGAGAVVGRIMALQQPQGQAPAIAPPPRLLQIIVIGGRGNSHARAVQ